uniref:Wall-associated receptor kinase galacturonan-binding domain-containing protein n=1 Tax=Aegilops tauschii TaxID=37682 RepID=M8BNM4_AEGTA
MGTRVGKVADEDAMPFTASQRLGLFTIVSSILTCLKIPVTARSAATHSFVPAPEAEWWSGGSPNRALVFVLLSSVPLVPVTAKEEHGGGCSAKKRCGNLTVSDPFWLADIEAGRSCGPLDFMVSCNRSIPLLRSSGPIGFAIMNISYEGRNLRVVDLHKEEAFSIPKVCHFPRRNTSSKLALSFKINPANLNLIFYNCTKTAAHPRGKALVEMRCVDMTNAYVRTGVPYDATGAYAGYALDGCGAIVMPVMGSLGEANASDYKQLINDGFLLTWDPAPARKFTCQIIF